MGLRLLQQQGAVLRCELRLQEVGRRVLLQAQQQGEVAQQVVVQT
jgi:hypothetical protein